MADEVRPRTVYLIRRTDKGDDGVDVYVGSTCLDLHKRLSIHKYSAKCKKNKGSKLYQKMCEVGAENWEIIPIIPEIIPIIPEIIIVSVRKS